MIKALNEVNTAFVLVNYNGSSDTRECVESIQKMEAEAGVIIVDNASEKSDRESLKQIPYPQKLIYSKENLGFAGGNNLGIRYAIKQNIENIILLNNDTVVTKDFLTLLRIDPEWGNVLLVPRMMYYSKPDIIWYAGGEFQRFTGKAVHYNINKKIREQDLQSFYCTYATGCCMVVPAKVFKRAGLLDERYFMYCEDTEYCLRIVSSNIKIKYIGKAALFHKVSNSSGGEQSPFSLYYMTRNRKLYLEDYKNNFSYCAIPLFFITRIFRIIQYFLQSRSDLSKAVWDGIRDAEKKRYGKGY